MAAIPQTQQAQDAPAPIANPAADAAAPEQVQQEAENVRTFAQTIFLPITLTVGLVVSAINGVVTVIKTIVGTPFRIASYVSGNSETWHKATRHFGILYRLDSAARTEREEAKAEIQNLKERLSTLEEDNRYLKGGLAAIGAVALAALSTSYYFCS